MRVDERRVGVEKEARDLGDFVRAAPAPEERLFDGARRRFLRRLRSPRRLDPTRRDAIYADVRRKIMRQGTRERRESALARRVDLTAFPRETSIGAVPAEEENAWRGVRRSRGGGAPVAAHGVSEGTRKGDMRGDVDFPRERETRVEVERFAFGSHEVGSRRADERVDTRNVDSLIVAQGGENLFGEFLSRAVERQVGGEDFGVLKRAAFTIGGEKIAERLGAMTPDEIQPRVFVSPCLKERATYSARRARHDDDLFCFRNPGVVDGRVVCVSREV